MKIYQISIIVFLASCAYDRGDKRLKIINQTKDEITLDWHSDRIPEYPSVNHTDVYIRNRVLIGDSLNLPESDANWPRFVQKSINKKLNLFVYNIDSLRKYGIDTLNIRKMYRRVEYSEKDLDELNWRVVIRD